MADDPHRPIILLGCTNTYQDPKRIEQLQAEREALARLFQDQQPDLTVKVADPEQKRYFFDHIRKHWHDPAMQLLHLSGYAAGRYFHFEGGAGEESLTADRLATVIGRLPGLQLVCLSGCATTELLEKLLLLDIPAILVASVEGRERDQLTAGIETFYQALAAGVSLRAAFTQLQEADPEHRWGWYPASYNLEHDHLDWPGRDPEAATPAWGLYVLPHNQARLDWALPRPSPNPEKAAAARAEARSRRSRRIGSVILASLLLIVLLFLLWQHPRVQAWVETTWQRTEAPCEFAPSQAYRVLQLPFARANDCRASDGYYDAGLTRRLIALGPEAYQICQPDLSPCRVNESLAEALMARSHAQLALWGTYHFPGRGKVHLEVAYRYAGQGHRVHPGYMSLEVPAPYFDRGDFAPVGIEHVIHWARAQSMWEQQAYEAVLAELDAMALPLPDSLAQARLLLRARAALRLGTLSEALTTLDSLIRLAPDHATAYHERGIARVRSREFGGAFSDLNQAIDLAPEGTAARYDRALLHLKFGRYEAAEADAQAVLAQQQHHGDAYGIMAAVHAARREKDSLLAQLEAALQHGLQARSFIEVLPAFAPFREDPDVKALLERFP